MARKIYLSGKITGENDFASRFAQMADKLSANGDMVFNPATHPDMFTHGQFMQIDLLALSFCDTIYLMNNWRSSKGAKMEFDQARILGLNFEFEEPLYQIKSKDGMFWNAETNDYDLTYDDLDGASLYTKEEVEKYNEIFFNGFAKDNIISTDELFPSKKNNVEINHSVSAEEKEKSAGVELVEQTSYKFRLDMEDGSKTPWQYFDRKPTEKDYAAVKKYYRELKEKNMNTEEKKIEEGVKLSTTLPKKTAIGYKVFYLKAGKLYPPMVKNPGGSDTPMGVWIDASAGKIAGTSKTGRPQVEKGGEGTHCSKGTLAYRPGWHLGEVPIAKQFEKTNPLTGEKELFPKEFVWAECEYSCDVDYQKEAMDAGKTDNGNFRHAYAGLQHVPENGSYRYRTNPDPTTEEWIITGKIKINRILTNREVDELCLKAGKTPQKRESDFEKEIEAYKNTPVRLRPAVEKDSSEKSKTASKKNVEKDRDEETWER